MPTTVLYRREQASRARLLLPVTVRHCTALQELDICTAHNFIPPFDVDAGMNRIDLPPDSKEAPSINGGPEIFQPE